MSNDVSLLAGSASMGYITLPLAIGKRWSHGQHGPSSASFKIPCRPFGALDSHLRRDCRLFVILGTRCVWSGYLLPVSSAQSDGEFVTVEAAGTFERGKHDESYVRTFTDADESKWWLRKGSSQRFTIENSGTLVLRAEGGGGFAVDGEATTWRNALWAELVYFLDDGLGDPTDVITLIDFVYNCDMTTSWVAYLDAYSDVSSTYRISRIWTYNATGSGKHTALACPAGTRALMFGLRTTAKNQLATDVFAELSEVMVSASSGRVRVDEALALVAADLTAGAINTTTIGDDLEHLVWPLGSGSRSYAQEQISTLHDSICDWRYMPPVIAPGEDSFIAREMPAAPDNRTRWWVVSAKDAGVTVDLTYQDPESMDVAGLLYSLKGKGHILISVPNPETVGVTPDDWYLSVNVSVTDTASGGWAFAPVGFLLTCDATKYDSYVQYGTAGSHGVPVVPGAEYRVTADVERVTTSWPTGSVAWPGPALSVQWYTAADAYISTTDVDWVAGFGGGESGQQIVSRGDRFTLGSFNGNPVTAPATAAYARPLVQWAYCDGGSGQVAVSNMHMDSLVVPETKTMVRYHPATPTSVDQRVRMFDYSGEPMTDAAADRVLHHAFAWYGVQGSECDREPFGTIGVVGTLGTVDGTPGTYADVQTGDWITVLDDVAHLAWPQMVVGVEVSDDDEAVSIQLGGDGGDFNYVGRAATPAEQKRKRRKGHHRRVLWHTWATRTARAAFKKQHKYKTFAAYMKANPLPKKHPKWGPG